MGPKFANGANKNTDWKKHECAKDMFRHYANLGSKDCTDFTPIQLLYLNNELYGFVWQHEANSTGVRWETPGYCSILQSLSDAPECMYDLAEKKKYRTLHVMLRDLFKDLSSVCNPALKKLGLKRGPGCCDISKNLIHKVKEECDENTNERKNH